MRLSISYTASSWFEVLLVRTTAVFFIYLLLFVFSLQGKIKARRLGPGIMCRPVSGQCFIITVIAGGSFSKEKPTGFANWIFELLSLVLFRTMCTLVMLVWGVLFGSMVKLDEFGDVHLIVPPSARWQAAFISPLGHRMIALVHQWLLDHRT